VSTLIAAMACLALLGSPDQGPTTNPSDSSTRAPVHRVPNSHLEFALPEGWVSLSADELRARNFDAGFRKPDDPQVRSSYFLLQVKRQKQTPAETLQRLATKAVALTDVRDLAKYISDKKYAEKPELYSEPLNTFFFVQAYPDRGGTSITVMAKRFSQYGYVLFHFYLRDELVADIAMVNSVLGSARFDEGFELRPTTPSTAPSEGAAPKR